MTSKEVEEKYGDVGLKFDNYYKYTFSYTGTAKDGAFIVTTFGGSSEDIYRYDVDSSNLESLNNPNDWNSVTITKGDEVIFDCDNF